MARTFCRNIPFCGGKLAHTPESDRRAFCCRGCYTQFYKNRCRVCEVQLPPGSHKRRLCKSSTCLQQFRRFRELYEWPVYHSAETVEYVQSNPIKTGTEMRAKVIGPSLSPSALKCATLGLDADTARHYRVDAVHYGHLAGLTDEQIRASKTQNLDACASSCREEIVRWRALSPPSA